MNNKPKLTLTLSKLQGSFRYRWLSQWTPFTLSHLIHRCHKNIDYNHFKSVVQLFFRSSTSNTADIYLLLCIATLAKSLKVFSLERVWESLDPVMSTALVSPNKAFSRFTSVITPSYYIPIMLHYGLQSSTMVLRSCQVRAGTLQHTPKYTQILSPTLYHTTPFHFSPDMSFVQYLIWTPPAPVWQRQRPTH